MSQMTLDSNTAPEGSAGDQPSSKQPAPRRRRRPASHAAAAATPAQPAAEAAAAPVASPAPAQEPAAQPAASTATPASAGSAAAPAQPAERARRQPSARPRSRRAASRKNDVQLVIAPAPPASTQQNGVHTPEAVPEPVVADQTLGTEAEPRMVPVMTEPGATVSEPVGAQPAEPLTLEPAATPEPQPQAPAPSRYRFGRRTAPFAPEQPMRAERLSSVSPSAAIPAAAEAEPVSAVRDDVVPELGAPSGAGADTDTVAPMLTPTQAAKPARDALDDIVAALGLRDATPAPTAGETTADVAPDVEAETEEAEGESGAVEIDEAETQTGARRRRRRRRGGSSHAGADDEAAEQAEAPESPEGVSVLPYDAPESERDDRNGYERYGGTSYAYPEQAPYSPYSRPTRDHAQAERQPWDIGAGEQQIRQPQSPFGAPEPSFARGFGPQPRGVAGPVRETFPRTGRPERTDIPPMSPNVLASTVTHAIQQQTDRLLSELRHQANPPAMSIMLPPFPSTERIGVFVDVANLLYSARSLRVSIDFGRLLDFLRGNRRLVRAHAYAPTNPDPHAEQSFLTAVKGLGYRITTKNYKTFSSGAKKADMDLDLCMDIVRLVDARALDTVVLVSGDSDFLPLLEYCSDRGVRVEVAAFDDSAAMILRQSCDLFINLSLVDDIRA